MPWAASPAPAFAVQLPDSVAVEVFASFPKFVPLKRKMALGAAVVAQIEAAATQTPTPGRPVIAPDPQLPAAISMSPLMVDAGAEAQIATTEVATLLTNPATNSKIAGSAITENLGYIAALGVRQGQPSLIRQSLTQIGGSGLAAEFNIAATQLQTVRGSDGRFASPQAADLGAAMLMAAKLELQSITGGLKKSVTSREAKRSEGEEEESAGVTFVGPTGGSPVASGDQQGVYTTAPPSPSWDTPPAPASSSPSLYSPGGSTAKVSFGGMTHISGRIHIGGPVGGWFEDKFGKIGDWFKGKFGDLWDNIGSFLEEVGNWFGDIPGWFADFGDWFGNLAENAQEWFVGLCSKIADAAQAAWESVKNWIDQLEGAIAWILSCASDLKNCIIEMLSSLLQWFLQQLLTLFRALLKNALQAIVFIFGELGKAVGGRIAEFDTMVRRWISGTFRNPLDDIAKWIWNATWGVFMGSIVCLCEKACIQPVSGELKDADNVWVKLIGTVLWYLHPILEGDPHTVEDDFAYSDMRPYSFCRWIYQGGVGMIPGVELEGEAQDLVDIVVDEFAGDYALSSAHSGPAYKKYMVDRVARAYMKDLGATDGVDGYSLTKGPSTLFLQQDKNARWYMRHPEEAQQVVGNPTASLNPTPAWIGLKARQLAENVVGNFCSRPASWMQWLDDQRYIHEIPEKKPFPNCATPTGEAQAGQCWYPNDWYEMLTSSGIANTMEEKCFNINAPTKYTKLLVSSMWNWNELTEVARDAFRLGGTYGNQGPDLFAGFQMDLPCAKQFEQWCIPPLGGVPSVFYMGWPTWQGKDGIGFTEHFPENTYQIQYFSYVLDWMEANSKPTPLEAVSPTEAAAVAAAVGPFNAGVFKGGQQVRAYRKTSLPDANAALKLPSGRILWDSIQLRLQSPSTAQVVGSGVTPMAVGAIPAAPSGAPAQKYRTGAYAELPVASSIPAVTLSYSSLQEGRFVASGSLAAGSGSQTMRIDPHAVGYDNAHIRYRGIWKAMTPAERRAWLMDYPWSGGNTNYYDNPYIYNPEGPPEAPDIQSSPGEDLEVGPPMAQGSPALPMGISSAGIPVASGSWYGSTQPTASSVDVFPQASVGGSAHTGYGLSQAATTVPQADSYSIVTPTGTRTNTVAQLQELVTNPTTPWGSFLMTRKRFWAGEMMAYFEGTQWANLDDFFLMNDVTNAVSTGDGTTPATPLLSFVASGDQGAGVSEAAVGGSPAGPPVMMGPSDYVPAAPTSPVTESVAELEKESKLWPWLLGGAGLLGLGIFLVAATDED